MFCRQCIHCSVSRGGKVVPRPFGEAVHGSGPNQVIHFDFLTVGLSRRSQFKSMLVIRDDLSHFIDMYPCMEQTAAFTAECLYDWFSRYGIVPIWVWDRGSHFLNTVIEELCLKLHAQHHFTLAYCPWSNGTIEVINSHILSVFRSLLSEFRMSPDDWPNLIPVVRFALNHTMPKDRPAAITLFTGLQPSSPLDAIWHPGQRRLLPNLLSIEQLGDLVSSLRDALADMHRKVVDKRSRRRAAANRSRNLVPNFSPGDYVLVSNTLKYSGSKLRVIWTGPCRITKVISAYVFEVENLVTRATSDVHACRMRFYSDSSLNITEDLIAQIAHDGHGFEISQLKDARWNSSSKHWELLTSWQGFEEAQAT